MKLAAAFGFATVLALTATASAQIEPFLSGNVVKIGVLTDMSSIYADIGGAGSVEAARMAIADFGGTVNGKKIELVSADHHNKPDLGAAIANQWFGNDGVDAIVDVATSSVALAVQEVAHNRNKVLLISGAAASDLTGRACSPTSVHWTYDTVALANGTGGAVVRSGGDTWFFITADYAFGYDLERDTARVIQQNGGSVLGSVRVPLMTADFSPFLSLAQASKAKVIGLANAGGDTINSIKQAAQLGIVDKGQKLAGLLLFISDVHRLGLQTAHGLQLTSAFYWDQERHHAGLVKALFRQDEARADDGPGRGVRCDHALPRGDQGDRHHRRPDRRQADEGDTGQRFHDQERQNPRGWDTRSRHVSVRGQEPVGIERPVGLLQADRSAPRGTGLQALGPQRMLHVEIAQ